MQCKLLTSLITLALFVWRLPLVATPEFVTHNPANSVYGETSDITMREPEIPREDEATDLWVQIGFSFYYNNVAIYYTTNGSEPQGSFGNPSNGSTSVLKSSSSQVTFVRNQPNSPNIDWWKAPLPSLTRTYGSTIKYKISAWDSGGGPEVFANNSGCADGTCDNPAIPQTTFTYTVKIAWPGKGSPNANPGAGYPNVHHWKEEAVVGNNFINVMLDQNGSLYDIYYPGAGNVQGIATKNEGYVDGLDTFPPGLPLGNRGQMHFNIGLAGIRYNGVTYWLSNEGGAFSGVTQSYIDNTNVVRTSQTLSAQSANIQVVQYDFAPKGVSFPNDQNGNPVKGIWVKRVLLTNNSASGRTVNFYYYANPAINGGDNYDAMFFDSSRGSMGMFDYTQRTTSQAGEYNPTFFGDYSKNVSVYFASSLKALNTVGSATGVRATDSWRDSSFDNSEGWTGVKVSLAPGETRELNIFTVGGFKNVPGDQGFPGTYDGQIAPALDWLNANSAATLQSQTENYWAAWVDSGTTIEFPDAEYTKLFNRSKLGTALHLDEKGGGVVAGMHNGAYPFVWPRDALWAAVTLTRTGHFTEAENVYRFLREVCFRAEEEPGRKGWFYQKYTTDGYQIWTAPQVDETANVPWGVKFYYDATGNSGFLNQNWQMVYESARSSSEDSNLTNMMYYNDAINLMYSNNAWEDSFDHFLYSNAACERGLRDAASIAGLVGQPFWQGVFNSRAANIKNGIIGRLDWNGENTDISQLGITYPYETLPANDNRMKLVVDRMNGVATDTWGNNHPIVNFSGEWEGLINRYWGDGYWNGGPWYLSTMWYGAYYAMRQDYTSGKGDIDNHKYRLDKLIAKLGPVGFGAEQIAPSNSLLYPGQSDFTHQAAWPNAWESMSFFVDSLMLFLDMDANAPANRLTIAPKLPSAWSALTFKNVKVGAKAVDIYVSETTGLSRQLITNRTAGSLNISTKVRVPAGVTILDVTVNGVDAAYSFDAGIGVVSLDTATPASAGASADIRVIYCSGCQAASVATAKSLSVGTNVYLDGPVVVRTHSDRFNIESVDRSSGIAVIGTGGTAGKSIKLIGVISQSGPEKVINLTGIADQITAPVVPQPLAMNNRTAGGAASGGQSGVDSATGLGNIGLDVILYGKVVWKSVDGLSILIDDGSSNPSRFGINGIHLTGQLDSGRFTTGQFVRAVGSMSLEEASGVKYPLLRVAAPSDIVLP